ncbi:hypothetical protein [Butyrivibrio sp. LC3010]|uniref:hypothetical protein n=1 Tax=Butyrivibrio sp. LC3010 TaxID=1280680 RepID=UPI000426B38C|nr:hypothetical protein [Butyrivibrio sp. LC3010]
MAQKELRRLNRKELLQMLVEFSEEAESIREHEKEMQEQFDRERELLLDQMANERAELLSKFDDEKAEMRSKFAEQKNELLAQFAREKAAYIQQAANERAALMEGFNQEKAEMRKKFNEQKAKSEALFQKDMIGLRARHDREFKGFQARLEREKAALREETDKKLRQIESAGTLAEAVLSINGFFEAAQKAAIQFQETLNSTEVLQQDESSAEQKSSKKKEAPELTRIKKLAGIGRKSRVKAGIEDSVGNENREIPDVIWGEEAEAEDIELNGSEITDSAETKVKRNRTTRKKVVEETSENNI